MATQTNGQQRLNALSWKQQNYNNFVEIAVQIPLRSQLPKLNRIIKCTLKTAERSDQSPTYLFIHKLTTSAPYNYKWSKMKENKNGSHKPFALSQKTNWWISEAFSSNWQLSTKVPATAERHRHGNISAKNYAPMIVPTFFLIPSRKTNISQLTSKPSDDPINITVCTYIWYYSQQLLLHARWNINNSKELVSMTQVFLLRLTLNGKLQQIGETNFQLDTNIFLVTKQYF